LITMVCLNNDDNVDVDDDVDDVDDTYTNPG
jgi:hypothetical protein